jgi:hypothetical protein
MQDQALHGIFNAGICKTFCKTVQLSSVSQAIAT